MTDTQSATLIALSILAAVFWLFCTLAHGYANLIDAIALLLHKHSVGCRVRQQRRTAAVTEQWVKQLERSVDL